MRVLSVIMSDDIGGIQNRVLMISPALSFLGVNQVLLVPRDPGQFSEEARRKGIKVVRASVGNPKLFSSNAGVLRNIVWIARIPKCVTDVLKAIRTENVDIVHINGALGFPALVAAKISCRPVVWHLISDIYPSCLIRLMRTLFFREAERLVFVAENVSSYYLGPIEGKTNPTVIHEPVDSDFYDPKLLSSEEVSELRRTAGIPEGSAIIGFVGNLTPQKGLDLMVRVAWLVAASREQKPIFLVVGQTPKGHAEYVRSTRNMIAKLGLQDLVIFAGRVPDLRPYMALMDMLIVTSRAEGTPLVILEAMSMGKTVVAVGVGGIREMVRDGLTGFVVQGGNLGQLAQSVNKLLDEPGTRRLMGDEGRRIVKTDYSVERCAAEHFRLYKEVLDDYDCSRAPTDR